LIDMPMTAERKVDDEELDQEGGIADHLDIGDDEPARRLRAGRAEVRADGREREAAGHGGHGEPQRRRGAGHEGVDVIGDDAELEDVPHR
jgi:hypothetical protein